MDNISIEKVKEIQNIVNFVYICYRDYPDNDSFWMASFSFKVENINKYLNIIYNNGMDIETIKQLNHFLIMLECFEGIEHFDKFKKYLIHKGYNFKLSNGYYFSINQLFYCLCFKLSIYINLD